MLISVPKVKNIELFKDVEAESSEEIRKRVQVAKDIQNNRFKATEFFSNSEISQRDIESFIKIDNEMKEFLREAVDKLNLSARSYYRLLKVARTIADLDSRDEVLQKDLVEALSYRMNIS